MPPYRILFDLYASGHHPSYLLQTARVWLDRGEKGRLGVAAPGAMFDAHPEITGWLADHERDGIRMVPLPLLENPARWLGLMGSLVRSDVEHGRILRRLVESEKPDRVILMFADHAQLSLGLGLRFDYPLRFSGIYFGPSFHYRSLFGSPVSRLSAVRKRTILRLALSNPHVDRWHPLDPYVVPELRKLAPRVESVALPDAFQRVSRGRTADEIRREWGVEPHRRIGLFFGSIGARKGIHAVLRSLSLLPDRLQDRFCLVIAGPHWESESAEIARSIEAARSLAGPQIVVRNQYVGDDDIQDVIRASDVVLVAYQRHIGSSGVLIRAAAEGVPVVASDWGLVGHYVRDRKLGVVADAEEPSAIAEALARVLNRDLPDRIFDPGEARRFAAEHTLEEFGRVLFADGPSGSRPPGHPDCEPFR